MTPARTGLGAEQPGFVHEALLYGSDEDFLAAAVPFLRHGLEAGEPTLLGVDERLQKLALAELDGDPGLMLVDPEQYAHPYEAIRRNRALVEGLVDEGAAQVRFLAAIPCPRRGWHGWSRYEAAINHLFDDLPAWGVCPYDVHATPDHVLEDVHRTHRHLATRAGGHRPNPAFVDPERFLARRAQEDVDPLEARDPDLDVTDPGLADARARIAELAEATALSRAARQDLSLAAGEVVANAFRHGRPPVRVRAWRAEDRVVVTVSDRGTGPDDPYVGMLPRDLRGGDGLGVHIAYRIASELTFRYSGSDFTARLVVRANG